MLYLEESIFALSCKTLPFPIFLFQTPNLPNVGTIWNENAGAPLVELVISVLKEGKLQVVVIGIEQDERVTTTHSVVYLETTQTL